MKMSSRCLVSSHHLIRCSVSLLQKPTRLSSCLVKMGRCGPVHPMLSAGLTSHEISASQLWHSTEVVCLIFLIKLPTFCYFFPFCIYLLLSLLFLFVYDFSNILIQKFQGFLNYCINIRFLYVILTLTPKTTKAVVEFWKIFIVQ